MEDAENLEGRRRHLDAIVRAQKQLPELVELASLTTDRQDLVTVLARTLDIPVSSAHLVAITSFERLATGYEKHHIEAELEGLQNEDEPPRSST